MYGLPLDGKTRHHPFRDYYLPRDASFSGKAFFMWWDLALSRIADQPSEIDEIAVDVLGQVLQLPAKGCQFAALHGLNHLHPNDGGTGATVSGGASGVVDRR